MTKQELEIATIKERTLKIPLSDADCDRLASLCGEYGISVSVLIKNFIGDLVDGTYSNGSDERYYARRWFDRCWFSWYPELQETLLSHLLAWGYDPEEYLDILDDIETAKEEKEYLAEHPEEADEEDQYIDDYIADWEEKLRDMQKCSFWEPKKEPNMEEEIELIKKWVMERNSLINN